MSGGAEANELSSLGLAGLGDRLDGVAAEAAEALRGASYPAVDQFAGHIEEFARTIEHLQLLAVGAVDRTRTEAIAAAAAARANRSRSWVTGWNNGAETLDETDVDWPAPATPAACPDATGPASSAGQVVTSPADDGCRNTAEFLRLRLRIPLREARRRLALAHQTLPGTSLTGEPLPPARPRLATALTPVSGRVPEQGKSSSPVVSTYAGTIIATALDRLERFTTPEALDLIERDLTSAAVTADPDFLARLVQRWTEDIDADGAEPSEEALRRTQGAFLRKPRHGLHHVEIFATTEQYEHLLTAMNAATNPRTTTSSRGTATYTTANTSPGAATSRGTTSSMGAESNMGEESSVGEESTEGPGSCTANSVGLAGDSTGHGAVWNDIREGTGPDLERRTRPQQQLDGIIGTVKAGLTTNALPATGGNRPQIIATINYKDLFPHLAAAEQGASTTDPGAGTAGTGTGEGTNPKVCEGPRTLSRRGDSSGTRKVSGTGSGSGTGSRLSTGQLSGTGNFPFTGPVPAETLRKIACDADIIPALLGTNGEILDLGRKTRLFTAAQRLALIARDQGCTFPNCTIPAPWCEAHHITYWSQGGPTNLGNGALLCAHHHHLIHKEQWTITARHGTPWFTPPRHIDPHQKPQQNRYFKPPPPPAAPRE
ncbi:HNH endonuclease signature motif containing protein [Pseudarthrobacter sp. L1SW]|uniref:HNH endonuclease signature motif containing protein n=1 Tax=Pseudarthrobacter sp. L1SW TaxID=2851598 RepID=UPI001E4D93ED|nr:HNH endonuclease signature motif containing protein [Pseudarthrobacter sp. L1SW]